MAAALEKIIAINAKTTGQQGLVEMDRLIRRLGPGAEASVTGVLRLNRVLGDMGTIAGGIGLAGLGASLLNFGRNSLQVGDDSLLVARRIATLGEQTQETGRIMEFAQTSAKRFSLGQLEASQAVADLYGRLRPLGVSMADIETTFTGVNKVARLAGLSALDAKEAFRQLGQAMGSGRLQGDELRSLMERMPQIGTAIVKVFNQIATSKGLEQITKDRAKVLVEEVKDGEKRQTQVLKDQIRVRQEAAEKETDQLLKEIARRYDALISAQDRAFDDQEERERNEADRSNSIQKEKISKQYNEEKKALDRIYEDRFDALDNDKALSDEQQKEIRRRLQDEQSLELEGIEKREQARIDELENSAKEQAKVRGRALEDERRQKEEALRDNQEREQESLKQELKNRQQVIEKDLEDTIAKNKKANETLIAGILARVKVTQGDLKQMGADGLITTEIMIQAMKELEKIQPPEATALGKFNSAIKDLSQSVGDNLLPALTPLIKGLTSLANKFGELPQPIQTVIVGVTALGVALGALQFVGVLGGLGSLIGLLGKLGGALAGARLAAVLAGWAGAAGPAVAGVITALSGILTWMATTFVPAMVGFFSGPVGWIALGVAALIAGMVFFREPIMKFFAWAMEQIGIFWKGLWDYIYNTHLKQWGELFNKNMKKPIEDFVAGIPKFFQDLWKNITDWANNKFIPKWEEAWDNIKKAPERIKNSIKDWFTNAYDNIVNNFTKIPTMLQDIMNRVTDGISSRWRSMMNGVKNMINGIISLWNSVASKTQNLPGFARLPIINPIPVEAFATGGFVTKPTMGLIGEGRQPNEYIIPEGSMDAAAAGWQAGLRGNQLVSAWQSSGLAPGRSVASSSGAGGPINISISGGTIQLPDGRQAITLDQVEAIATAITRSAAPHIVRASVQASGRVMGSAAGRSRYGLT